jgi:hypothetical protein
MNKNEHSFSFYSVLLVTCNFYEYYKTMLYTIKFNKIKCTLNEDTTVDGNK